MKLHLEALVAAYTTSSWDPLAQNDQKLRYYIIPWTKDETNEAILGIRTGSLVLVNHPTKFGQDEDPKRVPTETSSLEEVAE